MALSGSLLLFPNDLRAQSVAILDSTGAQVSSLGDPSRPANATLSTVAASTVSVTLLASNPARRRFRVANESGKRMFLAFSATASVTAYTVVVDSQSDYEGVLNDYTGVISAIWSAGATGNARVTEITT